MSLQGIIERDQIVFQKARTRGIPIVMVTSGGYQRRTARIIADSLLNLRALSLIVCDEAENCPPPPGMYCCWSGQTPRVGGHGYLVIVSGSFEMVRPLAPESAWPSGGSATETSRFLVTSSLNPNPWSLHFIPPI